MVEGECDEPILSFLVMFLATIATYATVFGVCQRVALPSRESGPFSCACSTARGMLCRLWRLDVERERNVPDPRVHPVLDPPDELHQHREPTCLFSGALRGPVFSVSSEIWCFFIITRGLPLWQLLTGYEPKRVHCARCAER